MGLGFAFDVAEGVRHAVAAGADVVNLSLGSTADSELLREVLAQAAEQVTIVASAGNDGTTQRRYPAAYEDVLSVASVNDADERSTFSSYGWVDVAAPGEDVVSTYRQDGFAAWDGTSMAAPWSQDRPHCRSRPERTALLGRSRRARCGSSRSSVPGASTSPPA